MVDNNLVDDAKKIIQRNAYLTLGTVSEDGTPWVSPLYFAYDNRLNFYWVSPKNADHSKNIRKNKVVSMVMFDSHAQKWTGVGLYVTALCQELTNIEEIMVGLRLEFDRLRDPLPDAQDFLGNGDYRVYKATASRVWITNDKETEGKTVDSRTEIDIRSLGEALSSPR